jgi:hypothetical protein
MDQVFEGAYFFKCYIDDVLVHNKGLMQHLAHLEKLFKKLHEVNMKMHLKKCQFNSLPLTQNFAKWYYGSLSQSSSHFGGAQAY